MKDDIDRWTDLEGPAPPEVQRLFDAVRIPPPDRTPQQETAAQQAILAALAEQDRRLDREERRGKRHTALGVGMSVAFAAVFVVLVAAMITAIAARWRQGFVEERETAKGPPLKTSSSVAPAPSGVPSVRPAPQP